jgi:hypothetical protein
MRNTVKAVCERCPTCQLNKPKIQKFGHLPAKVAEDIPWDKLYIDLVGPYKIEGRFHKEEERTLHCLTMLDPATGWFEIAEIPAKRADVIINVLEQKWLARYPRPTTIIMDRGSEFMAEMKEALKDEFGITRRLISTRNPQSNVVERAHQTLHNLLQCMELGQGEDPQDKWDGVINAVGFAMRATVHLTNKATPMQLVFGRDAILPIKFQADWQYIREQKQRIINQNNERENAKRIPHTYQAGDRVLILQHQHRKHGEPRYTGPHTVDRVNDNGTLRLRQELARGGAVYRTWNIRNVFPYKD